MLIARAPLRIPLGGGGTDLPGYSDRFGGELIAVAIRRYAYVALSSGGEEMSFCDLPWGGGLGRSGAYHVARQAVLSDLNTPVWDLAERAFQAERGTREVGRQDQYMAAFGGIRKITIGTDGKVSASPLNVSRATERVLMERLMLFSVGQRPIAHNTLGSQAGMVENLHEVKRIGQVAARALEAGNLSLFSQTIREHWALKRERIGGEYDGIIRAGMENGASAGKLCGAGDGGHVLFYSDDPSRLRAAMEAKMNLREVPHHGFDTEGVRVIER